MSRPITVRVVCEGPTDFIVIRSIIQALGVDAVVTQIQPEDNGNLLGDAGEREVDGRGSGDGVKKQWASTAHHPRQR